MKNLNTKLVVCFAAIISLSFLLTLVGVSSSILTGNSIVEIGKSGEVIGDTSALVNDDYTYLLETPIEQERALREMKLAFTFIRFRGANFAMETENPDIILNTLTPQFEAVYADFNQQLNLYIQSVQNDTRHSEAEKSSTKLRAEELRKMVDEFKLEVDQVRAVALTGDASGATATLRNTIAHAGEINAMLDEMIEYTMQKVVEDSQQARQTAADVETVVIEAQATVEGAQSLVTLFIIILVIAAIICIAVSVFLARFIMSKVHWYENILDNIPFPLSISDNNLKWTFINKVTENFLGKKRAEVIGQPCSNWGAAICNTEQCGVRCLERGEPTTKFNQGGMDFKVDTSYLTDKNGKKTGHIELVQDITKMLQAQKHEYEIVQQIRDVSVQFSSMSKQIADEAQTLSQGSIAQSSTVDELSGTISMITDNTKKNADLAAQATTLAEKIKANAEEGNHHMDEMMSAVEDINEAGQQIGKVIKVIDDIAFQTNILALNAAVEAARAGQHGKGFAVVAEEVRNLASKSSEAAKDTAGLIENSMKKAERGTQIAGETSESLKMIVSGITDSSLLISEIADLSKSQSHGIEQINDGIAQVSQVILQNSATAEQSAASAEEMNAQVNTLEELLQKF